MNPLYYAKRQVTDFYAQPSTPSEPVMTLQFQDLTEYGENPLYAFVAASSNERYVDNNTEVDICCMKFTLICIIVCIEKYEKMLPRILRSY